MRTPLGRILPAVLLATAAAALTGAVARGQAIPEFKYLLDAESVVLDYSRHTAMPYRGEPAFGLEVYGDGRAVAKLPKYFPKGYLKSHGYAIARRGYFEARLTPQEVDEILQAAEPACLIDTEIMKQQRRQQHPGRAYTDGAATHLKINLSDYRPASGNWQGPVAQSIEWSDVYGDAELYPDVAGIQALWKADKALSKWVLTIAERVEAETRGQ